MQHFRRPHSNIDALKTLIPYFDLISSTLFRGRLVNLNIHTRLFAHSNRFSRPEANVFSHILFKKCLISAVTLQNSLCQHGPKQTWINVIINIHTHLIPKPSGKTCWLIYDLLSQTGHTLSRHLTRMSQQHGRRYRLII